VVDSCHILKGQHLRTSSRSAEMSRSASCDTRAQALLSGVPQMAAYAVGRTPLPTLHWQHRRSESVKLIALMAGLLLVGGLVVASVRVRVRVMPI